MRRAEALVTRGETGTWLYGVIEGAPALGRVPNGPPATGRVRLLDVGGGLSLVASDAPLARFGSESLEAGLRDEAWVSACALAHEAVIEHFMKRGPVLPMKLFTIFHGDERAVARLRRDRTKLARMLSKVGGCAEWSLRIRLDEVRAERLARTRASRGTGSLGSGTAFLAKKKNARDEVRRLRSRALAGAERALATLGRQARQSRRRAAPPGDVGARLLLDAVLLVPTGRAKAFVRSGKKLEKEVAKEGCRLVLSGPWPPYHFVDA